jgi:DNA-binding transcriptional ArsR family regulator
MTYAKTDLFDEKLQELAELAKVLSHPARLAILNYLAKTRMCISGDISNELPLSRTTVSQHLQELKKAGLIQGTIEGVKISYCLDLTKIKEAKVQLEKFMNGIECCKSCGC